MRDKGGLLRLTSFFKYAKLKLFEKQSDANNFENMKKFFLLIIFLFTPLTFLLASTPVGINSIINIQKDSLNKTTDRLYPYSPWETTGNIKYKTDSYETSQGETGYIIYAIETTKDHIYTKITASGIKASDFNYEHETILTASSTAELP
jgi:hypothetical protein